MGEALTIGARHEPGYTIVTVGGEIDIATVTQLREGLVDLAASGCPLVADLGQVRFIDSAGLSALVGAANRAAVSCGSLHVVCAGPEIRQLFRLTGLDHWIPLARILDEAREALATRTAPSLASRHRRGQPGRRVSPHLSVNQPERPREAQPARSSAGRASGEIGQLTDVSGCNLQNHLLCNQHPRHPVPPR